MLNRAALILRYKQPFVDWINAADPSATSHALTLEEVNQEHTMYLVEVEDEGGLADWLTPSSPGAVRRRTERLVHGPGAVAAGPVAHDVAGVVFIRAAHHRGRCR